ncbi:MAG TPA: methyltransferase domain-containing protein [Terriglobales bacterium]|nr:methyltransferase domain-containing protein [Terriglobales bacterium]
MNKPYINLGCGSRFHPDWENVDIYPSGPGVRVLDLTGELPYREETFEVVYHSHVLEHLSKKQALPFLCECFRILKPGGIIRVAVPDLENIARLYIDSLEKVRAGVPGAVHNHEWMTLELLDQCVREETGGAFTEYFRHGEVPNWDFIAARWGSYADIFLAGLQQGAAKEQPPSPPEIAWGYILRNPTSVLRNKVLKLLIGAKGREALKIGQFRRAGEVHMWMYDSHSLAALLQKAGFEHAAQMTAFSSRIPNWTSFELDTNSNGTVYKADSLYMEAVKP